MCEVFFFAATFTQPWFKTRHKKAVEMCRHCDDSVTFVRSFDLCRVTQN